MDLTFPKCSGEHLPHDSKSHPRPPRRTGRIEGIQKKAWDNLQELRWVLKDVAGVELPGPERKTIDLEGRIVKDGVRKALRERQAALADLVHAVREYRKIAESKPLTYRGAITPMLFRN